MRCAHALLVAAVALAAVTTVESQKGVFGAGFGKKGSSAGAQPPPKPPHSGPPSGMGGRGGPPGGRGGPGEGRPGRPERPERPPAKQGQPQGGPQGGPPGGGRGGADSQGSRNGPRPDGSKWNDDGKVPGGAFNWKNRPGPPSPGPPPSMSDKAKKSAQAGEPGGGGWGNRGGAPDRPKGKPDNTPKSKEAQAAFDIKKAELAKKRKDYMDKTGQTGRAGAGGKGPGKKKDPDSPQAREKASWRNKLFGGSGPAGGGMNSMPKPTAANMGRKAYEKPLSQKEAAAAGKPIGKNGAFDPKNPMESAKARGASLHKMMISPLKTTILC